MMMIMKKDEYNERTKRMILRKEECYDVRLVYSWNLFPFHVYFPSQSYM